MQALENMSIFCYKTWYEQDVAPNLTKEQKTQLLHRLSDLSLKIPFMAGVDVKHEDVPELAPFSHTENFSGIQLYAVMMELGRELLHFSPELKRRLGL